MMRGLIRLARAAALLWCSASAQIEHLLSGDSTASSDFVVLYPNHGDDDRAVLSTLRTFDRLGWTGLALFETPARPRAVHPSRRMFVVNDAKLGETSGVPVEARICATAPARCAAQPADATSVSSDSSGEPRFTLDAILSAGWRSGLRSSSLRCLVLEASHLPEILAASDISSVTVQFILLLNAGSRVMNLGLLPDWLGYEVVLRTDAATLLQLRTEPRAAHLVRITFPLHLTRAEPALQRVRTLALSRAPCCFHIAFRALRTAGALGEQVRVRASSKLRHHRLRFYVNGRFAGVSPLLGASHRGPIEVDSWVQLALPSAGDGPRAAA